MAKGKDEKSKPPSIEREASRGKKISKEAAKVSRNIASAWVQVAFKLNSPNFTNKNLPRAAGTTMGLMASTM